MGVAVFVYVAMYEQVCVVCVCVVCVVVCVCCTDVVCRWCVHVGFFVYAYEYL